MTDERAARATRNRAIHRAQQLRQMASDLRQMPASSVRWKLISFALDRLASLMVARRCR